MNLCLSGDPSCCGVAPCAQCGLAVRTRVLPDAMVAGGFNGSAPQAQAFFEVYMRSYERLVHHLSSLKMQAEGEVKAEEGAPHQEAYGNVAPPTEAPALSAEEIAGMGTVEDFVEDEELAAKEPPTTFSPKAARALARKARRLKQKRAGKAVPTETKEEGTHGKQEE